MKGYNIHVPTWYSMINMVLIAAFAIVFLLTMTQVDKPGALPMFILMAVFLVFGLIIWIYIIATGRYPLSFRPRGKF